MNVSEQELRYLELLAKRYPSIQKASTEIINLKAILSLPKGTEHFLSDLGGAAFKDDRYFYFVSLAGFLRACVSVLFSRNRQWEPSERHMADAIGSLALLPEDFLGRWNTLMRTDGMIDPAKRYQIAQLIARSIFALG